MKKLFTLLLTVVSLTASAQIQKNLGADLSVLPAYEAANTPYYTTTGSKISDVITYIRDNAQMNSVRVRLYVSPDNSKKDGSVQDLDYVTDFGKRIKDAGMTFLLDFQYSDSWADPDNQNIPKSWYTGTLSSSNPSNSALNTKIYEYTKECLQHLKDNGAAPDHVQIGNEVSYGMLWRTTNDRCYSNSSQSAWNRFTDLLKNASKAVRETLPKAKVVLHLERSGDINSLKTILSKVSSVDYDIIGLSYYPFWHGTVANLGTNLSTLATLYPKKEVQIVETAYYYQYFPSDSKYTNTTSTWAATSTGQKAFIEDLITELNKHSNVTGLYYWFAEENGSGGASWSASNVVLNTWINRGLWDNNSHKALPALFSLKNFNGENVMSVNALEAENNPNKLNPSKPMYDLQGRRLSTPNVPGIYLQNNKKFLVK